MHDFEQFLHCFTPFSRVHIRNSTPLGGACYIRLTMEPHIFNFLSTVKRINNVLPSNLLIANAVGFIRHIRLTMEPYTCLQLQLVEQ